MEDLARVLEFRLKLYPDDFDKVRDFYETLLCYPVVAEWNRGEGEQMAILSFSGGTSALVKWKEDAARGLFQDEAEGMRTLRQAAGGDLHVPDVLGVGDRWLIMENVEEGKKEAAAASFGRGLAEGRWMTGSRSACRSSSSTTF